jgi:hypothetical protein
MELVRPYNGVKTVEKSLRIVELLLTAQEGLSIGSRGWTHTSGMGRALLAAQSDAWLGTYIRETGLPRIASRKNVTGAGLLPHGISYPRRVITVGEDGQVSGRQSC